MVLTMHPRNMGIGPIDKVFEAYTEPCGSVQNCFVKHFSEQEVWQTDKFDINNHW